MLYKQDFKATIIGFENGGRDQQDKEYGQPPENWKGKEMDPLL